MPPLAGDSTRAWHALTAAEALSALGASIDGLSDAAARQRLRDAGPNTIPRTPPASWFTVLRSQFGSVVVWLLLGASVVAFAIGDPLDAAAIAVVLILNVTIGMLMELRAHRAVEALSRLEARRATVLRDGRAAAIDAREVVPGDVVVLEEGQSVPADGRLLGAASLQLVESALTGESAPVVKRCDAGLPFDTTLPERTNMVFAGTTVAAGAGRALVVATGPETELGAIGRLVESAGAEKTPLERRLDELGRQLVWVGIVVGIVTGVLAWIHGATIPDMVATAIALAVAAVPEGLPAVATIALAIAVRRMARRRALVRRLPAVESLGSVTVLCTDKTGTLTCGETSVTEIHSADGQRHEGGEQPFPRSNGVLKILEVAVMANRADAAFVDGRWVTRGDPTETALAVAAARAGIDRRTLLVRWPEIGEVPFSSDRRMMATFHRGDGPILACVKGAPRTVLALCGDALHDDGLDVLDAATRQAWLAKNEDMAGRGMRVLAVAFGTVAAADASSLHALTFAGLVGISDPISTGVRDAVHEFRAAGIRTVMVTGDQRGTAIAIARDLDLDHWSVALGGRDLEQLTDDELQERVATAGVFYRISPAGKLRIVTAYQRRGDIVAMIGDGVNDAAALKKADIGVTMGRGTDMARETAAAVLEDDRFETIAAAIEEGRVVFDNIRKFVFYLFSCNLAEVLVFVGTGAAGLPLPLRPVQILWLNLATDTLPALALALEPPEPGVMRRPPRRPGAAVLSGGLIRSAGAYAVLIAAPVVAVIVWAHAAGIPGPRVATMTFMALACAQLLHLGNARDRAAVLAPRRMFANRSAIAAVLGGLALQVITVTWPPLSGMLQVVPMAPGDWAIVAAASLVPAIGGQAWKLLRSKNER